MRRLSRACISRAASPPPSINSNHSSAPFTSARRSRSQPSSRRLKAFSSTTTTSASPKTPNTTDFKNLIKEKGDFMSLSKEKQGSLAETMGHVHMNGIGLPKNLPLALKWYKRASELGRPNAQFVLGTYYSDTGDEQQALHFFSLAATQGHLEAQVRLGSMYENGLGVGKPDMRKAAEWYEKAASQGHTKIQVHLASIFMTGRGVDVNVEAGFRWFKAAAEGGDPRGQYNLGVCYYNGRHVKKDIVQAVAWWQKAVEQDHSLAGWHLSLCYARGVGGLEKNEEKALLLQVRAAEQGHAEAQYTVGRHFLAEQDHDRAMRWLGEAAAQGWAEAEYTLGGWLLEGSKEIPVDQKRALILLNRAAEKGLKPAQEMLYVCYSEGFGGVRKNKEQALLWGFTAAHNPFSQTDSILQNLWKHGEIVV